MENSLSLHLYLSTFLMKVKYKLKWHENYANYFNYQKWEISLVEPTKNGKMK